MTATIPEVALPYGARDLRITPYADASATALAAQSLDLPYIQTMSFTESEDFEELRGDDATVTTRGKGAAISWDTESGGIQLDAYAAVMGGTVTESGVAPAAVRTYSKTKNDSRPFFRMEGQAISDSGGDVHALIYRCRSTDDTSLEFADGAFLVPAMSGSGLPSVVDGEDGVLYDLIQNMTVTPIPGPSEVGWGGEQGVDPV